MPADILLYALIAAGLVFWLKSILGTKNDEDDQKRSSLFSNDEDEGGEDSFMAPLKKSKGATQSNVVTLDALAGRGIHTLPRHVRIDNKTTENILDDIAKKYEDFDIHHFATGAESAFEIVIEAFADGDLDTLKELLEPTVYNAFEGAVQEREKREESVETDVKSIERLDITGANLVDDVLYITVRFTAREICVIRDKNGEIISGDPKKITQMVDVWVFSRNMESGGPEWYLHETRDDEIEDHKTPIPETGKDTNA